LRKSEDSLENTVLFKVALLEANKNNEEAVVKNVIRSGITIFYKKMRELRQ